MNTKTLSVVLIVLVALLVVRGYYRTQQNQASQSNYALTGIDDTSISSITIKNPQGELKAKKTTDGWHTEEDIRLDNTKITNLIATALAPQKSRLVSETDRRHQELEVADASPSARITLASTDTTYEILLGIQSGNGRYTRVKDSPQVYLVEGFPARAGSANIDDWYDTKVVSIDTSQLKTITVEGIDTLDVIKQDDGWYVKDADEPLSEVSIGPLINEIDSLVATGLYAIGKEETSEAAILTVTITKQDDSQVILEVFSEDEEAYLLTSTEREGIFNINQATFNNLQFTQEEIETVVNES